MWNDSDVQREKRLDLVVTFTTAIEASNRAREHMRALKLILEEVADFAATEAQWVIDTEWPKRVQPDSSST